MASAKNTKTEPTGLLVENLRKTFSGAAGATVAVDDVSFHIEKPEFFTMLGPSGCGKTTTLRMIAGLEAQTSGRIGMDGLDLSKVDPSRRNMGMVFQSYALFPHLSVFDNAAYGLHLRRLPGETIRRRIDAIFSTLGLTALARRYPSELSGGQQQRVSIARALMNGGEIILADEPTGALDTHSGAEVMKILRELHAEGHTIILVTHDKKIAEHADRVVEISDGVIISDERNISKSAATARPIREHAPGAGWRGAIDRMTEAFRMAGAAIWAHKMRSLLTMLGIIIGIASVVSVVALGNGSQQQILQNISALGTNTIDVYPGRGFGDMRSARVQTLKASDADALARQSYVDSSTPSVSTSVTARYRNQSSTAQVSGVGEQFFRVKGVTLLSGSFFDADAVKGLGQVAVIDENTQTQFFPDVDPIGQVILLGNVPARVVGVAKRQSFGFGGSTSLSVWLPYTTVMSRMLGQSHVSSITVRVDDATPMDAAQEAITRLLTMRHGTEDFFLSNSAEIRQTIEQTTRTMTLLIGAIAAIALLVGGIGVMNIMLVSVTERTREIGVRMAVGARQSDIRQQFLIEAVLVCLLGGVLGIGLALLLGSMIGRFASDFQVLFSTASIVAAFACSTLIGVAFGFLPARNAAQLDPVEALARE